jgi:Predicted phosphoesterases, related to the Icc protein
VLAQVPERGAHYKADVLILGGDMTGKALVPIIHDGGDNWHATLLEVRREMTTEEEVAAFEDRVIRRGYYPFRTDPVNLQKLSEDEGHWHGLFQEKMLETVEKWMRMADERLGGTGVRVFCCPGNDDQFEVDEIIDNAKTVELAEGRVIDVDGFQMVSTGWSNRTPWHTYRRRTSPT